MGAQASGKGRRMPQPNQGLGQTFDDASLQQYGGYGTGKSRRPTGPSQFAGNTPAPRQGVDTPDLSGIGRYMPPGVSVPPGEAKPDTMSATPPTRGGPMVETNPLARSVATPAAPPPRGGPMVETNPLARALNTGAGAGYSLPLGEPKTVPQSAAVGAGVPSPTVTGVSTAATPPATPYNTTPGVAAAYGVTPQQGGGAYDLAPNGQANWQANWQPMSAAAPSAGAPFGTDDYGNAFTSAAQAEDWRARVAARAAALSGYTFADQARDRGY